MYSERVAAIWAKDDHWNSTVQESFEQACPTVNSIRLSEGVLDHAFMFTQGKDGSKFLADLCFKFLTKGS